MGRGPLGGSPLRYVERSGMKKVAVVGSRSFSDRKLLNKVLDGIGPFHLISGGAKGADSMAEVYADAHDYPKTIFLPEWEKYGRSAGFRRNYLIIQEADEVIAFWDGASKGTKHSIELAQKLGKKMDIHISG